MEGRRSGCRRFGSTLEVCAFRKILEPGPEFDADVCFFSFFRELDLPQEPNCVTQVIRDLPESESTLQIKINLLLRWWKLHLSVPRGRVQGPTILRRPDSGYVMLYHMSLYRAPAIMWGKGRSRGIV